ncbi:hypothetical protein AHAS_Ahas17G0016000 [Arachis hypogaea]
MLNHITGESIPMKHLLIEDEALGTVNPKYATWKKQDAQLKIWLLASMRKRFNTHMIWKRLETFFASQITVKIRQLKNKLVNKKKECSICDYLLEIKKVVDSLICVGATINDSDHVDAILNGLPEEYTSFITTITARFSPVSIEELEALLMAHEELLDKYKRLDNFVQTRVAHV